VSCDNLPRKKEPRTTAVPYNIKLRRFFLLKMAHPAKNKRASMHK